MLLEGNRSFPPCLVLAASKGRTDLVATLLSRGINVNVRDAHHGMTALHAAARLPSGVCARLLVTAKADVDARDFQGLSPVHYACLSGFVQPLAVLLESGASVHAQSKSRSTPLHAACARGMSDCAMLLVRSGASPLARDSLLRTPGSYASRNGFSQLASSMEAMASAMGQKQEEGSTATRRRVRLVKRNPSSPSQTPTMGTMSSTSTLVASPSLDPTADAGSTATSLTAFHLPASSVGQGGVVRRKREYEYGDDDFEASSTLSSSASLTSSAADDEMSRAKRATFMTSELPSSQAQGSSSLSSLCSSVSTSKFASGCVAQDSEDVGMDWF